MQRERKNGREKDTWDWYNINAAAEPSVRSLQDPSARVLPCSHPTSNPTCSRLLTVINSVTAPDDNSLNMLQGVIGYNQKDAWVPHELLSLMNSCKKIFTCLVFSFFLQGSRACHVEPRFCKCPGQCSLTMVAAPSHTGLDFQPAGP